MIPSSHPYLLGLYGRGDLFDLAERQDLVLLARALYARSSSVSVRRLWRFLPWNSLLRDAARYEAILRDRPRLGSISPDALVYSPTPTLLDLLQGEDELAAHDAALVLYQRHHSDWTYWEALHHGLYREREWCIVRRIVLDLHWKGLGDETAIAMLRGLSHHDARVLALWLMARDRHPDRVSFAAESHRLHPYSAQILVHYRPRSKWWQSLRGGREWNALSSAWSDDSEALTRAERRRLESGNPNGYNP